jgi:membrane associated rhomboid family serine protease
MSNPAPSASGPSALDNLQQKYYALPFFTRSLMSLVIAFYLVSWFVPTAFLACCSYQVTRLQLWRLFTSPLAVRGLLELLFGLMVTYQQLPALELQLGTLSSLFMYGTITTIINLLYVAVTIIVTVASGSTLGRAGGCVSGLWAPFMALLTIQTRRSSQESMSFWGMCNIPTKWYPLFLVAIFSLLGSDPISLLAGVAVGFAYESGRCSAVQLSDARLQGWDVRIQTSACMSPIYYAPGYIPHVSAQLAAALPIAFAPSQRQQDPSSGAASAPSSGGFMDRFRVRSGGVLNPAASGPSGSGSGSDPFAGQGHSLR